jgi:hypothetical protein
MFLEIEFFFKLVVTFFFWEIFKHKWTDSIAKRKGIQSPPGGQPQPADNHLNQ